MGSQKEPDCFVKVKERDHPSIVVEIGWSESARDLIKDAHLWLWGTEPSTQYVILIEHVESKVLRDDRLENEKKWNLAELDMEERLSNGGLIKVDGTPDDDVATQWAWREQLLQLHHEDKLMKPLLGSVKSTLYIYRRTRDGDDETKIVSNPISTDQDQDIYLDFEAEIYPNVPTKATKVKWEDILGKSP